MPIIAALALAAICPFAATLPPARQRQVAETLVAAAPSPVAIAVAGAGVPRPFAAASGLADPRTGRKLTPDTPLRIASVTKTFVAVTLLRLHEAGRIDLDATIDRTADPKLIEMLEADRYPMNRITLRQVMSHSAGLYDQGSDPRFIARVLADPKHVWTRAELVALTAEYADPPAGPGEEFRYSDTGYILLGDVVERVTGRTLAAAVREAVGFEKLGLRSTWWELVEPAPRGIEPRARQFLKGVDGTDVHPSYDLYGGGGLVMSARDLATFMAALFEGRIFSKPETLRTMLAMGPHKGADRYRLGMQARRTDAGELYYHSGFWGTGVYYDPLTRRSVAGVTTEQQAYRAHVVPAIEQLVGAAPVTVGCAAAVGTR